MIKELVIVGTFNNQNNNIIQQVAIFPEVVKTVIEKMSGITGIQSVKLGQMRTANNLPTVSRAKISINAQGNDPDINLARGSVVGLSVVSPTFKLAVIDEYTSIFGSHSILDISSSLDSAIDQTPPGLIIQNPPPANISTIMFKDVLMPSGEYLTKLSIGNQPLGVAETALVQFTGSPYDDGIQKSFTLFITNIDLFLGNRSTLLKDFELITTMTIDGAVYENTINQEASTLIIKKDNVEVIYTSNTNTLTSSNLNIIGSTLYGDRSQKFFNVQLTSLSDFGSKEKSFSELGSFTNNVTNVGGSISFKNNTDAPIPVGSVIADLYMFGGIVV